MKRIVITATLVLAACGHDDTHDVDKEACTLITQAATAVTAAADRAAAPAIQAGETPYEVTLDAAAKSYVRVDVTEGMDAVFFLNAANVSSGKMFFEGAERTLASSAANENCAAAIPDHYHVEMDEPGTYHLEFNPSAAKVTVVLHEESGDHAHE